MMTTTTTVAGVTIGSVRQMQTKSGGKTKGGNVLAVEGDRDKGKGKSSAVPVPVIVPVPVMTTMAPPMGRTSLTE